MEARKNNINNTSNNNEESNTAYTHNRTLHTYGGIIVHGKRLLLLHIALVHTTPNGHVAHEEENTYPVACMLLDDERSEAIQKRAKEEEEKERKMLTRTQTHTHTHTNTQITNNGQRRRRG